LRRLLLIRIPISTVGVGTAIESASCMDASII
jgi:hypothetical protein